MWEGKPGMRYRPDLAEICTEVLQRMLEEREPPFVALDGQRGGLAGFGQAALPACQPAVHMHECRGHTPRLPR